MKHPPRYYQTDAVKAASLSVRNGKNPLIVLPTGTGKALCVSMITAMAVKHGRRVLNLTHRKNLIEQNYLELLEYEPGIDAGIYSAGLKRRDKGHSVIFAGIQSYVNHVYDSELFDYIIVDEAHWIPPDEQGMYGKAISVDRKKNPKIRVIGLTATARRMDQGLLTEGDGALFDEICYEAFYLDMVREGYLAPITAFSPKASSADLSKVHIRKGDYVESEATEAFMRVLPEQVARIVSAGKTHKKWCVFATSTKHADALGAALNQHVKTVVIHSKADDDPDEAFKQFKYGDARCAVSVDMMTTGTNVPEISLVALCRGMISPVLYVQSVGRLTRTCKGKTHGEVLDFGGNIERHGPFDLASRSTSSVSREKGAALAKQCKNCEAMNQLSATVCENCGSEFEAPTRVRGKNLVAKAAEGGITSIEPKKLYVNYMAFVADVTNAGNQCVIIQFWQSGQRFPIHREWLLLWHDNLFAKNESLKKLAALTGGQYKEFDGLNPVETAQALTDAYDAGAIPKVGFIMTLPDKKNPKYSRIVATGNDDDADAE